MASTEEMLAIMLLAGSYIAINKISIIRIKLLEILHDSKSSKKVNPRYVFYPLLKEK